MVFLFCLEQIYVNMTKENCNTLQLIKIHVDLTSLKLDEFHQIKMKLA